MIEPYSATAVVLFFLLIFGLICPIVGVIPKVKEIISLRYLTLVVWLACMLGVIVNFGSLGDGIKLAVVVSTAIISVLFISVRSIEKALYNGWSFHRDLKASVSKGDAKAEIEIKNVEKKDEEKEGSDLKGLAKYEQGE